MVACIALLAVLTACTPRQAQVVQPAATGMPQVNMPNPASVYCMQQGYTLEFLTTADGSQTGICWFPDGSSCDEWAYYRDECSPAERPSPTPALVQTATPAVKNDATSSATPETSEKVDGWWGVIVSTPPGAQFDDAFERRDLGQVITLGIDSLDPAVQAKIVALRDSGRIVHLYGTRLSNVPDVNGSQIQVVRLEVERKRSTA